MRVVSLVPSLTETVAVSAPSLLVGATDYCTHPADLDVARVGGSKYPSIEKILATEPDLVLMNEEENRLEDAEALRSAGLELFTTFPRSVVEGLADLNRLFGTLHIPVPMWFEKAEAAWAGRAAAGRGPAAVIPVWRRPWVVVGGGTFAGDVLARLGVSNVYGGAAERYPRPSLPQLRASGAELVVLPDEPYAFSAQDGPEAFPGIRCALVSGRHLTWYGPSLAEAPDVLSAQLEGRAS
jgi:ABC-type Fe3+-hydroxamate transport system substrate-binding protein